MLAENGFNKMDFYDYPYDESLVEELRRYTSTVIEKLFPEFKED